MHTSQLRELARYKAKVADLESARQKQLARLHAELGFSSRDELIDALRSLGRDGSAQKPARARRTGGARKRGRRKRTTITPELRAKIESAVRGGGKGQEVADKFDVSLPTVQNIKRAAGLTRGVKKK